MKFTILNLPCAILALSLMGCGCQHLEVPCQPGEKHIFNTVTEANTFRQLSGNDLNNTGRVVEITAPTSLLPKR